MKPFGNIGPGQFVGVAAAIFVGYCVVAYVIAIAHERRTERRSAALDDATRRHPSTDWSEL